MADLKTLESIIFNKDLTVNIRGDSLVSLAEIDSEKALTIALGYLNNKDSYLRSAAALALGKTKDRRPYSHLIKIMRDTETHVRSDAAVALAETKDSRALFALVNFYNARDYQERVRVLLALEGLRDPRSIAFLRDILQKELDASLKIQVQKAISSVASGASGLFVYTYYGLDEDIERAKTIEGQICITKSDDLDTAIGTIQKYSDSFNPPRPQTYVVTLEGNLMIGGLIQEHVEVAKGKDVLTAGEIEFGKKLGRWVVSYVNNRSNGYYPDPVSFRHVKIALTQAGIDVPQEKFTEEFPQYGFNDPDFLEIHPKF